MRDSEFACSIQGCLDGRVWGLFLRRVWGHSKAGSPSRKGPPYVPGIRDLFFFFVLGIIETRSSQSRRGLYGKPAPPPHLSPTALAYPWTV